MRQKNPIRFMIMDACVLIDYMNGEPDLFRLISSHIGPTSFQDNLCFLTAKRKNLTCVTNDKNLRLQCENSHVSILWGLELVLELAKTGGISRKKAMQIAIEIHVSNPRHISQKVLDGFLAKLASLY